MFRVIRKLELNASVKLLEIEAPNVARKAEPGQFIIIRANEYAERIPLTIADYDREKGTVTIIVQEVGCSTNIIGGMEEGDEILDFVGPLGVASCSDNFKKVAILGGGLGTAMAYPQAKKLHGEGVTVDFIAGFRNSNLVILENEITDVSSRCYVTTDDGSNGNKGYVTDILKKLLEEGNEYDIVLAIGPLAMMKAVSNLTKKYGVKTVVSMNPIMIDGTGMCGGCRLTVGGVTKFACVDGPEFDGHEVDFDEAIRRQTMYLPEEKKAMELHQCNLMKGANE